MQDGKRAAPRFTEADLRDLHKEIKDQLAVAEENKVPEEETSGIHRVMRLLDTTFYNPRIFRDVMTRQCPEENSFLADIELRELPKHINDAGFMSNVIVKWRLKMRK